MKARSGDQFIPYEKLRQSRRYQLLSRLDQLEMVSVQHNRSSVDRTLTAVLMSQCNGPSPDALQSNPICSCGFHLGEEATIQPIREIEKSIDLGIRETVEALKASTYQEKILPYLVGLEEVGEKDKASAIRRVLALSPSAGETFLSQLEEVLNPLAIQGINEVFRKAQPRFICSWMGCAGTSGNTLRKISSAGWPINCGSFRKEPYGPISRPTLPGRWSFRKKP